MRTSSTLPAISTRRRACSSPPTWPAGRTRTIRSDSPTSVTRSGSGSAANRSRRSTRAGRGWSEGVGAVGPEWDGKRGERYAELLRPEGPIVFAGEHLSYVGLWQEGAALSTHEALKLLHSMAAEKPAKAAA